MYDTINHNGKKFPVRFVEYNDGTSVEYVMVATTELLTALNLEELYGVDKEVTAIDERIFFYVDSPILAFSDESLVRYLKNYAK